MQPVIVQGVVGSDGTLSVADKVQLPPGRVRIIVLPPPGSSGNERPLAEVLEQTRKDQAARGFGGSTPEEMEAARKALQAEEEEEEARWREIHSHTLHPLPPVDVLP